MKEIKLPIQIYLFENLYNRINNSIHEATDLYICSNTRIEIQLSMLTPMIDILDRTKLIRFPI